MTKRIKRTARRNPARAVLLLGVLALVFGLVGAWAFGVAFAGPPPPPPPAAPKITSSPADPTNLTAASFAFNSGGATSYLCSTDVPAMPFAACTSPKAYLAGTFAAGAHTFQVEAKNANGTSAPTSFTWTVDLTAPTVSSISATDANPTNANPLHWLVTFSEPVKNVGPANFGLVTSGLGGTAPSIQSVAPGPAGPSQTWMVTVKTDKATAVSGSIGLNLTSKGTIQDAAGNSLGGTPPIPGDVYAFDTTPPAAPAIVSGPSQGQTVASTSATFGFSAELGATFLCKVDPGGPPPGFNPCSNPATFTGLSQGNHTLQVEAVDAAGNVSPATSRTWAVDTVPPPVPRITSAPPAATMSTSASIAFNDPEAGVIFKCRLNGGGYSTCFSPQTFSGLSDGTTYTFDVTATDAAGNVSPAATATWTVDTTPPQALSIVATDDSPTTDPNVHWTVSFSEPVKNVDAHDFTLVIGAGLGGKPKITSVTPAPGTLSDTWVVTASTGGGIGTLGLNLLNDGSIKDAAGNPLSGGTLVGDVYDIDHVVPPMPTFTNTPTDPSGNSVANFVFSELPSTPDFDHFECSFEDGPFYTCTSPQYFTLLADGNHEFEVRAVDTAGNVSKDNEFHWKIKTVGSGVPFTIHQVAGSVNALEPGQTDPVPLTIDNPNSVAIYVTQLTLTISANASSGSCNVAANFTPGNWNASIPTPEFVVPANATGFVVAAADLPTITMAQSDVNDQTNCVSKGMALTFGGSAHS